MYYIIILSLHLHCPAKHKKVKAYSILIQQNPGLQSVTFFFTFKVNIFNILYFKWLWLGKNCYGKYT